MRSPPAHPFAPLDPLRLTIALDARYEVVRTIFDFIWREGRSVADEWPALIEKLGVGNADALLRSQAVKNELRANGDAAVAAGVFGVPTFVAEGNLFWGEDATAMLRAYLADPALFDTPEMRRASALPAAASRIS
jgi:2-hydroxychromene-2-carboxylate isomerase